MKNKKIKEYINNEKVDIEKIMNDFTRICIYDNKKTLDTRLAMKI